MKKSFNVKAFAMFLAILAAFSALAGCSCGKVIEDEEPIQIEGKDASWNAFRLFVPEGMELVGGSALDASDPNTVWVQKKNDTLSYFLITVVTEDVAKESIKTKKEINSASDVTIKAGNIEWKGIEFKYAGLADNFDVYATVNGRTEMVSGSRKATTVRPTKVRKSQERSFWRWSRKSSKTQRSIPSSATIMTGSPAMRAKG